jgi:inosine-uridine nucleoside N-ribohydrolase
MLPTDPDDCLAITLLARAQSMKIVGLSTVFGNASRDVVDRTVAQLRDVLAQDTGVSLDVWPGAAAAGGRRAACRRRTHSSQPLRPGR